jgi:hypothetical protein
MKIASSEYSTRYSKVSHEQWTHHLYPTRDKGVHDKACELLQRLDLATIALHCHRTQQTVLPVIQRNKQLVTKIEITQHEDEHWRPEEEKKHCKRLDTLRNNKQGHTRAGEQSKGKTTPQFYQRRYKEEEEESSLTLFASAVGFKSCALRKTRLQQLRHS